MQYNPPKAAGLSTSNMLSGSMIKLTLFFSEFQCNENNAGKPISAVALSSTENPWKIKDNTRKENWVPPSPVSLMDMVWVIKIALTAVLTRESGSCKRNTVALVILFLLPSLHLFHTCKNVPRIIICTACSIASSQNMKGQVVKALTIPRKQAASCRDTDTIISLE